MAGGIPYGKKYRFVLPPCTFERLVPPGIPVYRVACMLEQVGAGFAPKTVSVAFAGRHTYITQTMYIKIVKRSG
jgi:hypothetical protein